MRLKKARLPLTPTLPDPHIPAHYIFLIVICAILLSNEYFIFMSLTATCYQTSWCGSRIFKCKPQFPAAPYIALEVL